MWHVSDGDLHAYLDGALDLYPAADAQRVRAHLEGCGECRDRLEAEAAVRAAASAVLARTGPDSLDVPPFEELRRRSEVSVERTGRRSRPGTGMGLGWAASLALALGVGWMMGRESDVRPGALPEAESMAPATRTDGVVPGIAPGAPAARVATGEGAGSGDPEAPAPGTRDAEGAERVARARDGTEARTAAAPAAAASVEPAAVAERPTRPAEEAAGRAVEQEVVAPRQVAPADPAPMGEPGTIVGRVVGEGTDSPLADAQVTVEGTSIATLTDAEGRYVLDGVPSGSRTVRLDLIGYETVRDTVTVRAGDATVVDLASPTSTIALEGLVVTGVDAAPDDSVPGWRVGIDSMAQARALLGVRLADSLVESVELRRPREQGGVAAAVDSARRVPSPTAPAAALSVGVAPGTERDAAVRHLVIPGLEVLQVGWTEVAPGVEGLLVVQRLAADTALVELRFGGLERPGDTRFPARDEADSPPPPALLEAPLPEGVRQVSARLGGGWVVIRGRLPEERLARLLDLVR